MAGSDLSKVSTLVFNTGAAGRVDDANATIIKRYLDQEADVLICGAAAAYDLENTASTVKIFPMIGVKYVDYQDIASYKVKGVDGDPISDGMSMSATKKSFEIGEIAADSDDAVNFLMIDGTDYTIGVRTTMENSKVVVLGFNFGDLNVDKNKEDLINKIIEWFQAVSAMGPEIAVDADVEFDNTDMNLTSEKEFVISNDGDETLTVTDLKVATEFATTFTFPDVYQGGSFQEFDVAAGQTKTINAVFAPIAAKEYATTLMITSNATNTLPDVNISGLGIDPSGVEDIPEISTFSVLPNPMATSGSIHYKVDGNQVSKLSIDLIDLTGKTVLNLVNSSNAKVEDHVSIPVDQLSNGTYYAVARINGKLLQLQVVVAK
jgi:type IX secretion system substrate protein